MVAPISRATASTIRASAAEVTAGGCDRPAQPHRKVWAIAGPSIIAGSSEPMVALVDAWAVGHLPSPVYLAAIAVGAGLFAYIFWAFGFLRMGTTGLIAQATGRRDMSEAAAILARAITLGLVIGLTMLLIGPVIFHLGLLAYAPPESVREPLARYFDIRLYSAPFTLMLYAVTGYLLGRGQARRSLVVQLVLNISNAALNLILVVGLEMGVAGVALGTLVATLMAFAAGLYFVRRDFEAGIIRRAFMDPATWSFTAIGKLFSLSGLLLLRTLILLTSLLMITRKAASLGEAELAATQIMNTFMMLMSLGLDGFAFASEALAGSAAGAKDRPLFSFWVRTGFLWSAIAAVLYAVVYALFGNAMVAVLTDLPSVRDAMAPLVPLLALMPLAGFAAYQFDGIYVGLTAAGGMLATIIAGGIVFALSVGPLSDHYGLLGLWGAFGLFLIVRGAGQALLYPRLAAKVGSLKGSP